MARYADPGPLDFYVFWMVFWGNSNGPWLWGVFWDIFENMDFGRISRIWISDGFENRKSEKSKFPGIPFAGPMAQCPIGAPLKAGQT